VSVSGSVNSSVAGEYVLTYTAIDSEGNTAKPLTRTVTVADTTAPVIYAPSDLETSALSASGNSKNEDNIKAFLNSAYATDSVDEIVQINNDSPETFPIGLTNVIFNAVDSSGNIANEVSASVFVKTSQKNIEPDDTRLTYSGRWDLSNPKQPINYWQGTSIEFATNGSTVSINLAATINEEYIILINGIPNESKLKVSPDQTDYLIANSLDGSSSPHVIEIFKETNTGSVIFSGIEIQNGTIFKHDQPRKLRIAFFGDSNMEGYSLYSEKDRGGMGTYYAYPSMTSRMLDADVQIMAKSGATLAGSGLNNVTDFIKSVNWPIQNQDLIDTFNPDVIIVNAGANDIYSASGGNQKTIIKQRYELVIEELRQFYGSSPHIVLMNAYGWDINEPANYSFELLENLNNVSVLLFPWCWEQWHGTMVEHAGQSRLLANHISQLNQNWSILSDAEVFNPFGSQNLITNGSFEEIAIDGFNSFGWRYFEDGVERINDSDSAAEGNYYIRLNAGELIHQGQDATGDFIPGAAPEGQLYEFSAMIRTNSPSGTAEISMDFEGQNLYGRGNTQTRVFSVASEWSEYSGEFVAPSDTWKIYLVLRSQMGQIDFDQVELRISD
jgi:lysophospholipase L1-like esterase